MATTTDQELSPEGQLVEAIVDLVGKFPDAEVIEKIKELIFQHHERQDAGKTPTNDELRAIADEQYDVYGIELDEECAVLRGESGGYVQGWLPIQIPKT